MKLSELVESLKGNAADPVIVFEIRDENGEADTSYTVDKVEDQGWCVVLVSQEKA